MSAEAIILLVSGLLAFVGALVATTATAVIYINNSLSANRQLLYAAIKEVTTTLLQNLNITNNTMIEDLKLVIKEFGH